MLEAFSVLLTSRLQHAPGDVISDMLLMSFKAVTPTASASVAVAAPSSLRGEQWRSVIKRPP